VTSKTRWILALIAALALLLTACGGGDEGDTSDGATDADGGAEETEATEEEVTEDGGDGAAAGDLGLLNEGVITVGSDIAFEPFEFIQDGEPAGFDIDLMNEIADRLGLEVEYVNASFDTIFTQLAAGDFDAIISAITITEERDQTIDFTDPYFAANQAVAVTTDGPDVASEDDLAGLQVAVQAGTTGLDYANENFTESTIVEFPTSEAAFTALESGQVDAVFIDLPVVSARVETSENVELALEVDTGELYGIGVQDGNAALRDALNEQLADIIADGTYEEIYSRWFEGDVPEQFRTGDGASADATEDATE